ncbi:hypothetical protein [Paenibacillus periandrae]|uniref:hypothetical protein n=1 Tax=Paenibacillus periandrae TaxID=1761741 RepID=UPI001F09D2DB|nr:hypothetical protein [Paenibacillus periandrae]
MLRSDCGSPLTEEPGACVAAASSRWQCAPIDYRVYTLGKTGSEMLPESLGSPKNRRYFCHLELPFFI